MTHSGENTRERAAAWAAIALVPIVTTVACGRGAGAAGDAGAEDDPEVLARATEIAATSTLPPRAETLSVAQAVEARAEREGAGARAVALHALAARLLEREWRVDAREQDAKEALDLYAAASKDMTLPGACDAGLRGARLAGDVAHDAETTYAEAYRLQRRVAAAQARLGGASPAACAKEADRALDALAPFRPPARVLEAIDRGLAGEGAVAASAVDAGLASVAPSIVGLEAWPGDEFARVVVALDRPARYRAADEPVGGGGARTFVDLDGVNVGTVARDAPMAGVVTRVRTEATASGSRVVLDLDQRAYRRVFYLPEPYRVIIDVARHPPGVGARSARTVSRVVVDPGHGGSDPGAIGPGGVREKDVTLAIARRVAPVLARDGIQVLLTRDDDRFVTLEERTARANAFNADLFVSIHCNAAERRDKRGVETYVLDTARDELGARIAARENATTPGAGAEIGSILASMRLADQSTRSARFADLVQRAELASIRGAYDAVDGGVHTAGFYVLVGARMPGVLFETSYISNAVEEARLASDDYEQRIADGLANAVKAYRQGR